MWRWLAVLGWLIVGASAGVAQDVDSPGEVQPPQAEPSLRAPILVIDPETLYRESTLGVAFRAVILEQRDALDAENTEIESSLKAEEQALTDQRATLEPEEFRTLAAAFDERVRTTRRTQDGKEQALQRLVETRQRDFDRAIRPVLGGLMVGAGAAAILERDAVFLFFSNIDVTDQALAAIDAAFAAGQLQVPAADASQP